ncbi:hypothetical protein FRC04_001142 [Tulasnella sp. 424]|nr:hypothetical protein FRC04_001142 [Tulasnella sp. 424]
MEHLRRPPKIPLLLEKAEPPDDHPNLRTSRADTSSGQGPYAPECSGTTLSNSQLTYTPRSPFVPPTPRLENLIDESASLADFGSLSEKILPYVNSMPSRFEVTSADAEPASLSQRTIPQTHIVHSVARVPVRHATTCPDLTPIQSSNPQSSTDDPEPPSAFAEWTPFIPAGTSKGGYIKKRSRKIDFYGGFSDVFRAEIRFRAPAAGPELMQDFALKILRRVGLDGKEEHQMLTYMNAEVITWIGLVHPNIVPLVGFTITPLPSLISPWYPKGNIRSYLNRHPNANRLKLIYDVAQGLEYLHSQSPSIAHGDIKPENVLINEQGDALLSDLGLATFLGDERFYTASHNGGGSFRYMAPELFLENARTCDADVYSFASLAFEVFTDHLPHTSLRNINTICLSMGNSKGQEYPVDDWSKFPKLNPIEDILRRCWSRRPEDRPSMKDIVEKLSILVRGAGA